MLIPHAGLCRYSLAKKERKKKRERERERERERGEKKREKPVLYTTFGILKVGGEGGY